MTTSPTAAPGSPIVEPAALPATRVVAFDAIPRAAWDRLFARTARPTPFARWTFHRAWWDAYGETAEARYLVCLPPGVRAGPLAAEVVRAIVPLMARHELEPDDRITATGLRHDGPAGGTPVAPTARTLFFGASYHADYATVIAAPHDLPAAAAALAAVLAEVDGPLGPWDAVDLRRLAADDPALPALEAALRTQGTARAWVVTREREDVCPIVTLVPGMSWDDYLASLDKKARHEIRRKIRRAEAAGPNEFRLVEPTTAAIDAFIELHQARWGARGLFPASEGGARSRAFLHRLAELERGEGPQRELQLGLFSVAGRVIFAGLGLADGTVTYFYNAGAEPLARELSPGVTGAAAYLRHALAGGYRRFDFLRGDEAYKYEWGAVDEPIERLVVRRSGSR